MNERLVHFMGEIANLLMVLQQKTVADRMQISNIMARKESTMAKINELLNEARELGTLYDDLPGDEIYDNLN